MDDGLGTWRDLAEAAIADLRRYAHDDIPNRRLVSAELYEEAATRLETSPREDERVREAAKALVTKLQTIHADPAYKSVWAQNQMRFGPYRGPTYTDELAELVAALGSAAA